MLQHEPPTARVMRSYLSSAAFLFLTIWLILTVSFLCIYRLPGDPARMILGRQASDESIRAFRLRAGLDDSLLEQYGRFLSRTIRLDFGDSLLYRRPVTSLLQDRTMITLRLVASSMGTLLLVSFALPVALHLCRLDQLASRLQRVAMLTAVAPPYILGVIALALFSGWLGWVSPLFDPSSVTAWVLPSIVLAAYPAAIVMRLFEAELQSVLHAPYIVCAKAMGFSPLRVVLHDAVPNALTAALPGFVNSIAAFLTGTFFVEVIFGIPGLGRLTYEAISNKDIALLGALCILFAALISAISTLLELARKLLDPRLGRASA